MSGPRRFHRVVTRVLSLATVAIGLALVVATVAAGGGPAAKGVLAGVLFIAAGGARLYLEARAHDG